MGRGSLFLTSFLLANFAYTFVAVAGASCNYTATVPCFLEQYHQGKKVTIDMAFRFLKRDLNDACRRINELKTCYKDATKNCDPVENNPLKKIWVKILDSGSHICEKNFKAFETNKQCLSRDQLSSAAVSCQQTHGASQRYIRHVCSGYEKTVKCVTKAIDDSCGLESRNIMERPIRNILSLEDIDHDCDQFSSGRSTEGSRIFSFILSTVAVMLALLLNI